MPALVQVLIPLCHWLVEGHVSFRQMRRATNGSGPPSAALDRTEWLWYVHTFIHSNIQHLQVCYLLIHLIPTYTILNNGGIYSLRMRQYLPFTSFLGLRIFYFFPQSPTILLYIISSVNHPSALHNFLSQSLKYFPSSSVPIPSTVHNFVHDYSSASFSLTVLSIEILYILMKAVSFDRTSVKDDARRFLANSLKSRPI